MVKLVGTRLRLFDTALHFGAVALSTPTFISSALAVAAADFAGVFSSLNQTDTERLATLIDAVSSADASTSPAWMRPTKMSLWPSVLLLDLEPVLFVDRERLFHFQSQLHQHAWLAVRSAYIGSLCAAHTPRGRLTASISLRAAVPTLKTRLQLLARTLSVSRER